MMKNHGFFTFAVWTGVLFGSWGFASVVFILLADIPLLRAGIYLAFADIPLLCAGIYLASADIPLLCADIHFDSAGILLPRADIRFSRAEFTSPVRIAPIKSIFFKIKIESDLKHVVKNIDAHFALFGYLMRHLVDR